MQFTGWDTTNDGSRCNVSNNDCVRGNHCAISDRDCPEHLGACVYRHPVADLRIIRLSPLDVLRPNRDLLVDGATVTDDDMVANHGSEPMNEPEAAPYLRDWRQLGRVFLLGAVAQVVGKCLQPSVIEPSADPIPHDRPELGARKEHAKDFA